MPKRPSALVQAMIDSTMGAGFFDEQLQRRLQQKATEATTDYTRRNTEMLPDRAEAALLRAQAAGAGATAAADRAKTGRLAELTRNAQFTEEDLAEGSPFVAAIARLAGEPEEAVRTFLQAKTRVTSSKTGQQDAAANLSDARAGESKARTKAIPEETKAKVDQAKAALSRAGTAAQAMRNQDSQANRTAAINATKAALQSTMAALGAMAENGTDVTSPEIASAMMEDQKRLKAALEEMSKAPAPRVK